MLPEQHTVFTSQRIFSVHQPLEHPDCRRFTLRPDQNAVRLFPLVVNHYLGSLERYMSRTDLRRNIQIYQDKAATASAGGGGKDGARTESTQGHDQTVCCPNVIFHVPF